MKKFRKILALAIALTMMLGMSIVAAAEESTDSATITISGLSDEATVTYKQIVEPDNTSTSGWKAVDDEVAEALGTLTTEDITDIIDAYVAATESQRMEALKNISTSTEGASTITVTSPGLYLINATDTSGKFLYKPMVASVGFGYTEGVPTSIENTTVVAKKGAAQVEKTADMEFVEIGDTVEYTITTQIPYIPVGTTETALFTITDTLTGGEYVLNDDGKLVVSYSGTASGELAVDVTTNSDNQTFTVDLSALTADNTYANTAITLTYSAKVTDTVIDNEAVPTYCGHVGEEFIYTAVTGEIEVTKTGDGGVALSGATFAIVKDSKYATLDSSNKLTGWVDNISDATLITTDAEGKASAYGFDRDLDTYKVVEYSAPEGYKVDTTEVAAVWQTDKDITVAQKATAQVTDTKLIELPFTGGSGTAVFTVFGMLLMCAAATLYLVNKKKTNK